MASRHLGCDNGSERCAFPPGTKCHNFRVQIFIHRLKKYHEMPARGHKKTLLYAVFAGGGGNFLRKHTRSRPSHCGHLPDEQFLESKYKKD